mgnify:CR=1 FL=1
MANHTSKPDDRSDNVEKLQDMVQHTIENIEDAEDTLENTDITSGERQQIEQKNQRREESISSMRKEIKDEAKNK